MNKILRFFLFAGILLWASASFAQTSTLVTATVVDSNGVPYAGARLTASLNVASPTVTVNSQAQCQSGGFGSAPCQVPIQGTIGPVTLDSTGSIPGGGLSLYSNSGIRPGGSQWNFTVQITPGVLPPFGTGAQTFTIAITVSGTTQSISTTLNAAAPDLTVPFGGGGGGVTAVTASAPILSSGGSTPNISCPTCGDIGGSIRRAGQKAYGSASNTIAGETITLDMAGITGADLGAKMNNCVAALPSGVGICDGSNLTGALTLSTAVTATTAVTFTFCGQQVTQTAAITLSVPSSGSAQALAGSLIGCKTNSTQFTKGANLPYQVIIDGFGQTVEWITLNGNSGGGFTGSGLHVTGNADNVVITSNLILAEAADDIDNDAMGAVSIEKNSLWGWGVTAVLNNGGATLTDGEIQSFDSPITFNPITPSGAAVNNTGNLTISGTVVYDTGTVGAIESSGGLTATGMLSISQNNGYPAMILGGFLNHVIGNSVLGGGANGPAISSTSSAPLILQGNTLTNAGTSADIVDVTGSEISIVGNSFNFTPTSGFSGLKFNGINFRITNNLFFYSATSAANAYLIRLSAGDFGAGGTEANIISDNQFEGQSDIHQVAMFNDNSSSNPTDQQNIWKSNICRNIGTCISRSDPLNLSNRYFENESVGTFTTFLTTGSTTDIVKSTVQSFTFATLPTAGNGSQIFCTDCTIATPTAGSGTGAMLFRLNGVWVGGGGSSASLGVCEWGLGDGTNAIASGTYPASGSMLQCPNVSASTWTITSIACFTDNAGSSSIDVQNNAGTSFLASAPLTCNATKTSGGAGGSIGSTTTLAPTNGLNFVFVADGTSKYVTVTVGFTY